nr:hypothetical protein [Allomuricauda sp.]
MKKFVLLLFIGAMTPALFAQKVIEKNIPFKDQRIEVELKFASDIEVKTWDKSTVYFKADISTDDGKYLDLFTVDFKETDSYISIVSEAEPLFKAFHDERNRNNPDKKKRYYYANQMYEFNYVLYVPKNSSFSVSSINGDLSSEIIEGDFTADLINGDIEIKKYAGNLELQTINGEIDLVIKNTSLMAETIHGQIYADENMKLNVKDRHVGQKIMGVMGQATHTLQLNTINGNMYLRL